MSIVLVSEHIGITVAHLSAEGGAPQVGITINGLDDSSPSVITVEVSWDGGETWHGVRGAQGVTVLGGTFLRDHVPPLNVPATYRLTVESGAITPDVLEATVTVPSDSAWIQDPLAPRSAVRVRDAGPVGEDQTLLMGALGGALWDQAVDYVMVEGSSLPVASFGQRLLAGDVSLRLLHDVAAEAGALRRLLLSAGAVVVRGLPAERLLDPVAHVAVGPAQESRHGVRTQVAVWDLSVRQVRPTSMRVVVPWFSYNQVREIWAGNSYDQVRAARPSDSYIDFLRDPSVP